MRINIKKSIRSAGRYVSNLMRPQTSSTKVEVLTQPPPVLTLKGLLAKEAATIRSESVMVNPGSPRNLNGFDIAASDLMEFPTEPEYLEVKALKCPQLPVDGEPLAVQPADNPKVSEESNDIPGQVERPRGARPDRRIRPDGTVATNNNANKPNSPVTVEPEQPPRAPNPEPIELPVWVGDNYQTIKKCALTSPGRRRKHQIILAALNQKVDRSMRPKGARSRGNVNTASLSRQCTPEDMECSSDDDDQVFQPVTRSKTFVVRGIGLLPGMADDELFVEDLDF